MAVAACALCSGKMSLRVTFLLACTIMAVTAELFTSTHFKDPFAKASHKIILRSKRQNCVCVSVFFPNTQSVPSNNFQCTCDPSANFPNFGQQQQELQRELQQVQPRGESRCGCQLSPTYTSTVATQAPWTAISFGTTPKPTMPMPEAVVRNSAPLYECKCVTMQAMQHRQVVAETSPAPVTTTTTAEPVVQTTLPAGPPSTVVVPGAPNPYQPCQCVEITIRIAGDRQFHCDCSGVEGTPAELTQAPAFVDPITEPPTPVTTTTEPPTTTTTTAAPTTTTAAPTTTPMMTTPAPVPTAGPFVPTQSGGLDAQPCVMIHISTGQRVCACPENYQQCFDNVCCNAKRYHSLQNDNDSPNTQSAAFATVDMLVEWLEKVRKSFS